MVNVGEGATGCTNGAGHDHEVRLSLAESGQAGNKYLSRVSNPPIHTPTKCLDTNIPSASTSPAAHALGRGGRNGGWRPRSGAEHDAKKTKRGCDVSVGAKTRPRAPDRALRLKDGNCTCAQSVIDHEQSLCFNQDKVY